MTRAELERALRAATSNEGQVRAVARFFAGHRLAYGHGTDNASDEAYWLLRHLQSWDDDAWLGAPDQKLVPAIAELAARRVEERKPMAYLVGEARFAGLMFAVDERALIPRSPLAEVVERRFAPWLDLRPGDRVLDVGTGSGCIAVAAAHHCPGALVDGTDISIEALAVAAGNVARHRMQRRVRLFQCDLFPDTRERYRVIISNPPYVPDGELGGLPPEYVHEPVPALAGGATGLALVDRILSGARARLAPDGVLILEVGGGSEAFASAHPRLPVVWVELERGGEGVLVVTAEQLDAY